MKKVINIDYTNLDWKLGNPELNIEFLEKHFPEHKFNSPVLLQDVEDLLVEKDLLDVDSLLDFIVEQPAIEIVLEDNSTLHLTNKEIISWNGFACEGYNIYSDNNFLYVLLFRYGYYSGALGIWDVENQNWIATITDESFLPQAVLYIPQIRKLIGYAVYHVPYQGGGEYFFVIDLLQREFVRANFEELGEVETVDSSNLITREMSHYENILGSDPEGRFTYIFSQDKTTKFKTNFSKS